VENLNLKTLQSIEMRHYLILFNVAIVLLCTNILYLLIFASMQQWQLVGVLMVGSFGYSLSILASQRKKMEWATGLLLATFNMIIFYFANIVVAHHQNHLTGFFTACAVAAVIFYDRNSPILRALFVALPMIFFCLVRAEIAPLSKIILAESTMVWLTWFADLSAIAIVLALVFFFDAERSEFAERLGNATDELEEETKAKEEALAAVVKNSKLATIGELAGNIAHEINNPISIVLMRTEQAIRLMEKEGRGEEKATEFMHKISETAHRIVAIVQSMKHLYYNDESKTYTEVPLTELVNTTIVLSGPQLRCASIEMVRSEAIGNQTLFCNSSEIVQVMLNLVQNAVHAIQESGRHGKITIDAGSNGGMDWFSVANNGPEIPKADMEKIMDPFYTTKPQGVGTGLGLSVSNGIIKGHGGRFEVTSTATLTKFIVRLPQNLGEQPKVAS
jgi:signal transduction histidine kinase